MLAPMIFTATLALLLTVSGALGCEPGTNSIRESIKYTCEEQNGEAIEIVVACVHGGHEYKIGDERETADEHVVCTTEGWSELREQRHYRRYRKKCRRRTTTAMPSTSNPYVTNRNERCPCPCSNSTTPVFTTPETTVEIVTEPSTQPTEFTFPPTTEPIFLSTTAPEPTEVVVITTPQITTTSAKYTGWPTRRTTTTRRRPTPTLPPFTLTPETEATEPPTTKPPTEPTTTATTTERTTTQCFCPCPPGRETPKPSTTPSGECRDYSWKCRIYAKKYCSKEDSDDFSDDSDDSSERNKWWRRTWHRRRGKRHHSRRRYGSKKARVQKMCPKSCGMC